MMRKDVATQSSLSTLRNRIRVISPHLFVPVSRARLFDPSACLARQSFFSRLSSALCIERIDAESTTLKD